MAANSWREISSNVGLEVAECVKRWKNTRDKYVRFRKKLATRSGDPGRKKVPAFYIFLSWLAPHIKHWVTESNFDEINLALPLCFAVFRLAINATTPYMAF